MSSSQRPTLPAPSAPEVEYLNALAKQVVHFAQTYAPKNTNALRMAEEAAVQIRRLAIAAGVPGGERVAVAVVPEVPSEEARGTQGGL